MEHFVSADRKSYKNMFEYVCCCESVVVSIYHVVCCMLLPWYRFTDFPALLAQRLRMGPRHSPEDAQEAPAVRLDRASLAQWENLAGRHDDGGLWVRRFQMSCRFTLVFWHDTGPAVFDE